MKIVLVDDSPVDRLLAEILFKKFFPELEIILFDNPKMAYNYLTTNSFDILITDYNMPNITGLDLIQQLFGYRQDLLIHHKLFLYTSDNMIIESLIKDQVDYVSGLLLKPLTKEKLTSIIQNAWKN